MRWITQTFGQLGLLTTAVGLMLLSLATAHAQRQKLLATVDYETGNFSQVRQVQPCGDMNAGCDCNNSVSIVTSPVKYGRYAARFRLEKCHERSEVSVGPDAEIGVTQWYGWSLYVPSDWNNNNSAIVSQFHRTNNAPDWAKGDPTALRIENGRWVFRLTYQNGSTSQTSTYLDLGLIEKGRWTSWVVQVKWTRNSDGFFRIYKNGSRTPKRSYTGATYFDFDGVTGPYFKMGVYKGDPNWTGTAPIIIYGDQYRHGDQYATYDDVVPENP